MVESTYLMKFKIPQSAKNIYHLLMAALAALFFRFPAGKLTVIGVTGTDGKTTTVSLINHILKESGFKVGMISTLGAYVNENRLETGFHVTTPSAFFIQGFLRKLLKANVSYAVIEVTSHALDQNRIAFVPIKIAVVTNVTHEHLDYHGSYKKYLLTKGKIFRNVKYRLLNSDDPSFEKLKMLGTGQLISYGAIGSDFFGELVSSDGLTTYAVHYRTKQKQLKTLVVQSRLKGEFNLSNILAAFAVGKVLGIEDKKVISAIGTFPGVEGRMEELTEGQNFRVVVDFAHTPKSIELALKTLRKETKSRLIVVFGAAGERDKSKRGSMGQIAASFADLVILTSEDPRGENPNKIIEDIVRGVIKAGGEHNKTFWKVPDRTEAITLAVKNLASEGDCVVLLGKGHEKSMNYDGKEVPWSDQQVAREALKERLSL